MSTEREIRIGTAGWNVPRAYGASLPGEGSHLERYATALNCAEINSTFYRLPRETTMARWAASTPPGFQFAVKAPKEVTHTRKLARCGAELASFFACLAPLGGKLGPVLVQLPPKLAFDGGLAFEFFGTLRELHAGSVVVEPRHPSWFSAPAEHVLRTFDIARAMADPPKGSPAAGVPGGWTGLRYFRLHGAPRTYWSAYEDDALRELAGAVRDGAGETWVIFDNTAQGHAFGNAVHLRELLPSDRH